MIMKTIRTYPSGCRWCNATGVVQNPISGTVADVMITCPVCGGSKTIIITEEYDQLVEIPTDFFSMRPPSINIKDLQEQLNKGILRRVSDKDIEETISYHPIDPSWWISQRKRAGLTLRQVADKTGISPATISRLERGVGSPIMSDGLTRLRIFYKDEEWKE